MLLAQLDAAIPQWLTLVTQGGAMAILGYLVWRAPQWLKDAREHRSTELASIHEDHRLERASHQEVRKAEILSMAAELNFERTSRADMVKAMAMDHRAAIIELSKTMVDMTNAFKDEMRSEREQCGQQFEKLLIEIQRMHSEASTERDEIRDYITDPGRPRDRKRHPEPGKQ